MHVSALGAYGVRLGWHGGTATRAGTGRAELVWERGSTQALSLPRNGVLTGCFQGWQGCSINCYNYLSYLVLVGTDQRRLVFRPL